MPAPLADSLSPRVRQLLPLIESGVAAGLSSREIDSALRAATGESIRRQTLLDVMRSIRGIEDFGAQLRNVRLDRAPDLRRVPEALTHIRRNLSSTVRVEGVDLNTGELVERFIQVTHDEILTRGEIEDIAAGFIDEEPEEYGIELSRVLLTRQVKRAA